jgi:hypothetical protein
MGAKVATAALAAASQRAWTKPHAHINDSYLIICHLHCFSLPSAVRQHHIALASIAL